MESDNTLVEIFHRTETTRVTGIVKQEKAVL